jgi:acetyl esterase/lipase
MGIFRFLRYGVVVLLIFVSACQQPRQMECGPEGKAYRHEHVRKNVIGKGDCECWIYEPSEPTVKTSPVVVFYHGWTATNPKAYGAWIKHLVRQGNIVIYPRYQESVLTPIPKLESNAAGAVLGALEYLETDDHVRPDYARVAMVGHSIGGTLTANLAATAKDYGLPEAKALMCVQPAWQLDAAGKGKAFEDLSAIPSQTLLVCVAGDLDTVVGRRGAYEIYLSTTSIPQANKKLVILQSDYHGFPPLQADHLSPLALDEEFNDNEPLSLTYFTLSSYDRLTTDALDYYGYWKLLDELLDAAFSKEKCSGDWKNPEAVRCMGKWSDGTPVKEMKVISGKK